MPSVRRRCSSHCVGMSGVWSRPYFRLARKCRSIRWRGFTGRGLQLRRVHKAGVWIISKTRDQKSLVDHCNPPYCCVYRDLFLCWSLSVPRKTKRPLNVVELLGLRAASRMFVTESRKAPKSSKWVRFPRCPLII